MLRKRLRELKLWMQERKIERFARIIATVQMTGDFPDDITDKEFEEVAIWDSIGRRVTEIIEQTEKTAGVTGIIDSASALAPKGENEL